MSKIPAGGLRPDVEEGGARGASRDLLSVEIVLRTVTPDGDIAVLPALVYAKLLDKHPHMADLLAIDRIIRMPTLRRPDARPWRERFIGRVGGRRAIAVVDYSEIPAIIVTVFDSERKR